MQFTISCFEVKNLGENEWRAISKKMVLEKLSECYDPISPVLEEILEGNEIVAQREIFRTRCWRGEKKHERAVSAA